MARSRHGHHWSLNPATVFLNHGSFGACPTKVLQEQSRLREWMETDPAEFFLNQGANLWTNAIESLASFLNADPSGLAFVPNSTSGVNTVLRSIDLKAGDEILVPNHAYQACRNAIEFVCQRGGAHVVEVDLPFELDGPDVIIDRVLAKASSRTRLAMIDTVSSPTAIRMPFETLTDRLQAQGVDVLLDCSHGPGAVALDLDELAAAYATGNCHKWLCTPKGSGFLHVREDRRDRIRPLPISHGYSPDSASAQRFRDEFDWQGTQDTTPWLCIPAAIEHVGSMLPGGWGEIMQRNHELIVNGRETVCEALGSVPPVPNDMLACMATLKVGDLVDADDLDVFAKDPLMQSLYDDFGIQLIVFSWPAHRARYLRISAALYNAPNEYEYLAGALENLAA